MNDLVECLSCREVMQCIYSDKIRDICHDCGGKAKE